MSCLIISSEPTFAPATPPAESSFSCHLPPSLPLLSKQEGRGIGVRTVKHLHPLPLPLPAMGASTGGPPPRNTLPPPSPSWAEVAGGGGEERRGSTAVHATRVPSRHAPCPAPPSASTQFEAWLLCRKKGIPAKLVLETDGDSEEISLWFRSAPRAPTVPPPPRRRRHRPGRNRRRRKREVERLQSALPNARPASAEATAVAAPTAGEVVASPPSGSPPAKRPRTRAAAREGRRLDPPTPEMSRASGLANPGALDVSFGEELYTQCEGEAGVR